MVKLYGADCQKSDQLNIASAVIKTFSFMPKIPDCDRCLLYAHNPPLICVIHPMGVDTLNLENESNLK